MKEKIDDIEQIICQEFDKEGEKIEKELEELEEIEPAPLPDDTKQRMKQNIDEQINQYEKETIYAKLSEEDRKALQVGQKMLKKKIMRKKRSWRLYAGLTAALVMVLGVGVNSNGGPERIIKMFTQKVGDREVSKVNSAKDIARSTEEREEEAIQKIRDELQTEIVRIWTRPDEMEFSSFEYDKEQQTAVLVYVHREKRVSYYISVLHTDSSWGVDIEDQITENWNEVVQGCSIDLKEYVTPKSKENRYSAEFEYMGVKYFINAVMNRAEFEEIINNLYFFGN